MHLVTVRKWSYAAYRRDISLVQNLCARTLFFSWGVGSVQVDLKPYLKHPGSFDVVSCQFAIHYSFASEARARMAMRNVSMVLRPGGYFLGTCAPDASLQRRESCGSGCNLRRGLAFFWFLACCQQATGRGRLLTNFQMIDPNPKP